MSDADRIVKLKGRAMDAEAVADNRRLQIEWLAGELAKLFVMTARCGVMTCLQRGGSDCVRKGAPSVVPLRNPSLFAHGC